MESGTYAELHCHSAFSLGDGASTPESLAARAAELGYRALALTDHDDLGGAVRFHKACESSGIFPISGAEITLRDGSHATLLVENPDGWGNLCTLLTSGRMDSPRGAPGISFDDLASHAAGIIALTGCPRGRIPRLLAAERWDEARAEAGRWRDAFGDRLYLELWDHRTHAEAALGADLLDLAREMEIPWTVTHDVHYATPDARAVHDALTCVTQQLTLEQAHRRGALRASAEWCLQKPEEMARRWRAEPGGVRRTLEIAERCQGFRLAKVGPVHPAFPLPSQWSSADAYLERLSRVGLAERLPDASDAHRRQLEHELRTIRTLGLADHFLVCWDICRFARDQGILCQGRGSAANSIVCYALRVTAVDPVAHSLLFERFLSLERPEPPDIDIDFAAMDARERVLQYVYEKYGRAHAAMVCTHVEYRGRSAIRDAMRVLGFPATQADWLAKRVDGYTSAKTAAEWLEMSEGKALQAIGLDPAEPRARALVRIVAGLDGLPRHRGIHSGGFVISAKPLSSVVPIEPASMSARTVIQWDKDDCADAGLPKFDLLGLGMLRLLGECVQLIRRWRGVEIDIGRLPLDDPAVYRQIGAADTIGLFQIESRAQANFLPRLRPTCFYDVVISVGAIRPGPMLGGQVKEMLARRRGRVPTEYPHPDLEPVLARTHGLALFQEQLMRCAIVVSGCSPGEADALRRAMSRKRSSAEMLKATERIRAGMAERGVSSEAAEKVLGWLEACASYTFPESHAISFALLAYASAWLRLYYPAEYLCAILNAQPMGFYPVSTLIHDAKAHGVVVMPVDLARSGWDCSLEEMCESARVRECESEPKCGSEPQCGSAEVRECAGPERERAPARADGDHSRTLAPSHSRTSPPAVRIGLRYVRGLGSVTGARLKAELERGAFASAADVVTRFDSEPGLRALAAAGAFRTWIPEGPRQALWTVLGELRARRSGGPLAPARVAFEERIPALAPSERTLMAHHTTGFDLDGHPMRHLRPWLETMEVRTLAELRDDPRLAHGERVTTAGVVIVRQRPGTAKGFVFVGLEDETGRIDVIVNPRVYAEQRETINGNGILAVRGKLGKEDGVTNLKAEQFYALKLDEAAAVVASHDYH
ncbi:error-prone DNA polymerase [Longimicrobium sp.]|uniref:DNA polymerase III subunit alpha n=1 Tax=Longimicrobium sp. TaxID=2029185 RepID=UPI002C6381F3|nr:error-prone DNA polymerase [Longimicrobium sp.]HSU16890.1 error-prone DNA polymerase [Longimicrobium sp.]